MYCKNCGAPIAGDARFCPQCGSQTQGQGGDQQQGWQQPQGPAQPSFGQDQRQQAQPVWGQSGGTPAGSGRDAAKRALKRSLRVSAAPRVRIMGIPVSPKVGIIILVILIIVCVILNRTGALS